MIDISTVDQSQLFDRFGDAVAGCQLIEYVLQNIFRVLLAANATDKPLLVALENGAQASLAPHSFSALRW